MNTEMCMVCGKYPVSDKETGHCEECRKLGFQDEMQAENEAYLFRGNRNLKNDSTSALLPLL
jgi:hypothetical protein